MSWIRLLMGVVAGDAFSWHLLCWDFQPNIGLDPSSSKHSWTLMHARTHARMHPRTHVLVFRTFSLTATNDVYERRGLVKTVGVSDVLQLFPAPLLPPVLLHRLPARLARVRHHWPEAAQMRTGRDPCDECRLLPQQDQHGSTEPGHGSTLRLPVHRPEARWAARDVIARDVIASMTSQ